MSDKYINTSECEKYFYEHLDDNAMIGAMNAIDEMPAADVQPVKFGKWEYYESNGECNIYICSVCNTPFELPMNVVPLSVFWYCPHCSADMRSKEDRYVQKLEKDLEQMKKLLTAAVEDLSCGGETKSCETCIHGRMKGNSCRFYGDYQWRYAAEALALIEGGGDMRGEKND